MKDCCAENFQWQSFQLKKNQNNQRYLVKSFRYHTKLMQNNICNKYSHVGNLNCHPLSYFLHIGQSVVFFTDWPKCSLTRRSVSCVEVLKHLLPFLCGIYSEEVQHSPRNRNYWLNYTWPFLIRILNIN